MSVKKLRESIFIGKISALSGGGEIKGQIHRFYICSVTIALQNSSTGSPVGTIGSPFKTLLAKIVSRVQTVVR